MFYRVCNELTGVGLNKMGLSAGRTEMIEIFNCYYAYIELI